MNHQLINTGAGWACLRCKLAWDQGEETGDCDPEGGYTFSAEEVESVPIIRIPDRLTLPDTPEIRQYAEQIERQITGSFTPITVRAESMPKQVAGTHYQQLVIQPTEFCQRNGLDFCVGSILKYISRYRRKNGVEDLLKARHFVEIRESFPHYRYPPRHILITMKEYVQRNSIDPFDAEAHYRLEAYYNAAGPESATRGAKRLLWEIDQLVDRAKQARGENQPIRD